MKNLVERQRKVVLSPYDLAWPQKFIAESSKIKAILGENSDSLYHIGSTAISGMLAKPTVDILVVVKNLATVDFLNPLFEKIGYQCMGEYGIPGRRYYWKGNPMQHDYHIHLFEQGCPEIDRHIAFRDYLRQHADFALSYANIKYCLQAQFPEDIIAYVQGKDPFIRYIDYQTGQAKSDQLNAIDAVVLEDYNPKWIQFAAAEMAAITQTVGLPYERMAHLGSTSVKNLKAKPTLDIFIALRSIDAASQWVKPLETMGYVYWDDNPNPLHHRFFKGMPPYGIQRTHHVHILSTGEDFDRRVAFRDILRHNPKVTKRYENLKCQLAAQYGSDREGYTEAKAAFIKEILKKN